MLSAELRTINFCCETEVAASNDLYLQSCSDIRHRHLSESSFSPVNSFYSGTESQQSISDRSYYDNVDADEHKSAATKKPANFLMPPSLPVKVNRSKSFQETTSSSSAGPKRRLTLLAPCRSSTTTLLVRANKTGSSCRVVQDDTASNHSTISRGSISSLSEVNVDCSNVVQNPRSVTRHNCLCGKEHSSRPFFVRILRQMQKISNQMRRCKKAPRGTICVRD